MFNNIDIEDMDRLERGVCVTLCKMEHIFYPSFFTIVVHLVVHLVRECQLGGLVLYRRMYPGERYNLFTFIDYVYCALIILQ
jgi:hypothetical protein